METIEKKKFPKMKVRRGVMAEIFHSEGMISKIARLCDVHTTAVSRWKRIPAKHVLAIEAETGISRHRIRPDIFGGEPGKKAPKGMVRRERS